MIRATAITAARPSYSLASCSVAAATTTVPDRIDIGMTVPAGVAVRRAAMAGMVNRLRRAQAVRAARRRVAVMAARRRSKAAVRLRKPAVAVARHCHAQSVAYRRVVHLHLPRRMAVVAGIAASNGMGRCSRYSIESGAVLRLSADMRALRFIQFAERPADRRRHIARAGPTRAERQS
jgi:hypothetical protein